MEDVDEVLSRAKRAEREFKREKRTDMVALLEALRRSVEEARRYRERGYKVGEAAAEIGVHRNTVRGWIERGLLRAKRIEIGERGDYLIPDSEVARARRAHSVSIASDPLSAAQVEQYDSILRSASKGTVPRAARPPAERRRKAAS